MRGFLVGTVGLAVLYAVLQPGATDRITQGGGWLATAITRLSSPDVALIPNRVAAGKVKTSTIPQALTYA